MHSLTSSLIAKFLKSVYDLTTRQSLSLEELEGLNFLSLVSLVFNGPHPFASFLCYKFKIRQNKIANCFFLYLEFSPPRQWHVPLNCTRVALPFALPGVDTSPVRPSQLNWLSGSVLLFDSDSKYWFDLFPGPTVTCSPQYIIAEFKKSDRPRGNT